MTAKELEQSKLEKQPSIPIVKYWERYVDTLEYKQHPLDACDDLRCSSDIRIEGSNIIYTLYFKTEIPEGYNIDIFARSSIRKYDLVFCNAIGIIDAPYRGYYEVSFKISTSDIIKLLKLKWLQLTNRYDYYHISKVINIYEIGSKICQVRLHKLVNFNFQEVNSIDMTINRGGGHGHTGL